jgi:hypothetical protein
MRYRTRIERASATFKELLIEEFDEGGRFTVKLPVPRVRISWSPLECKRKLKMLPLLPPAAVSRRAAGGARSGAGLARVCGLEYFAAAAGVRVVARWVAPARNRAHVYMLGGRTTGTSAYLLGQSGSRSCSSLSIKPISDEEAKTLSVKATNKFSNKPRIFFWRNSTDSISACGLNKSNLSFLSWQVGS